MQTDTGVDPSLAGRVARARQGTSELAQSPAAELTPVSRRRFVSRTIIANAARTAPRIESTRFRADMEKVVDPHVDV